MVASSTPDRLRQVVHTSHPSASAGRSDLVITCLTLVWDDPGSNLTAVRSCHAHAPPPFRPRLSCSYLAKSRPQPACLPVTLSPPDSGVTR